MRHLLARVDAAVGAAGGVTLRDSLAIAASAASSTSCHRAADPLGLPAEKAAAVVLES